METLDVKIMGREFRVACTSEEKPLLLRAVNIVETKMTGIRDTGKIVGVDKIAVMAALQIAHESLSGGNPGHPALGLDIEALERKIESIEQMIESTNNSNAALESHKAQPLF